MKNKINDDKRLSKEELLGFSVKELAIIYEGQGNKLDNVTFSYYDDKYYNDKYYDDKYYDDKYYDAKYQERYSERGTYGESDRTYVDRSYADSAC
jgi:hypothetical protein